MAKDRRRKTPSFYELRGFIERIVFLGRSVARDRPSPYGEGWKEYGKIRAWRGPDEGKHLALRQGKECGEIENEIIILRSERGEGQALALR